VAALADSAVVHWHALAADFRERAVDFLVQAAALAGLRELARSRAQAVDWVALLVSRALPRSVCWAVLAAAFLLKVAVADWLPVLLLCSLAVRERASHSPRCETQPGRASCGQRELLEPKAPSSLRPVCLQASPVDVPMASQQH
jgi:hypothetical protein